MPAHTFILCYEGGIVSTGISNDEPIKGITRP